MSDKRLTELEVQLTHQAAIIEELSEVVRLQGDEIELLKKRADLLLRRAAEAEVSEGGTIPLADQRPPHW